MYRNFQIMTHVLVKLPLYFSVCVNCFCLVLSFHSYKDALSKRWIIDRRVKESLVYIFFFSFVRWWSLVIKCMHIKLIIYILVTTTTRNTPHYSQLNDISCRLCIFHLYFEVHGWKSDSFEKNQNHHFTRSIYVNISIFYNINRNNGNDTVTLWNMSS